MLNSLPNCGSGGCQAGALHDASAQSDEIDTFPELDLPGTEQTPTLRLTSS